ncbi:uncharacterized protein LOC132785060 [Drosophila nasuta]|uniref:Uncharacterized protein LOC117576128 n=1 Tax=Drosophila albomicans TaxID=7291 RepID=A0A6P8XTA5_DROAB|nr:uncharacterized protein LOC117576128 [Drosophila albomicans]XP_060647017.1 uncharacterized protein LOC132785060 [Drosophila nasuta]
MLSKKEFVAILLLVIALICILNAASFGNIVPTTTSYYQLAQQSASASTAYICVIYALSTWLYHSNFSEPRQHIRIVFLAMLLIMIITHIAVLVLTIIDQYFNEVDDSINLTEIHTNFGMTCRLLTIVLTTFTIVLLVVVFIYLCIITVQKQKEQARRRENIE